MGKALIIGCGGVASVAIHKCCQNSEAFEEICIASRTKSKCDALKEKLEGTTKTKIQTAQVDANNVDELIALIEKFNPDVVLNLALPYQDLTIMDACLATKTHYIDTANYEPEDTAKFEYKWQWAYREKFKEAGITALLGSGFDPGVTGVFSAYALKHEFDEINYIDILDCNGGDRIVGAQYAGNQADPLLHDLRSELPDPFKVSGERRYDFDRADYVRRKRDRTAAVLKGSASGSGIPWSSYCWKNEYRMHFPG